MKVPKKSVPIAFAVLAAAFFASATALGKPAKPLPPKAEDLPQYMVHTANLGNASYMACLKAKVKRPAEVNVLSNFHAAIACQEELNL